MFSDNKDFYPTPEALFHKLLNGKRHLDGRILEPSAGKGDMIRYIRALNRRSDIKIDAIENDSRLVSQLFAENINVVWDDFLTYESYKEYGTIVMNPPFSNGVDHVLKALELAEKQLTHCEIFAILNKETINNAYSNKRQELLRRLDEHGAEIEYVKDGFMGADADRNTNVEVALIRVSVVPVNEGKSIYERVIGDMRSVQASADTHEELSTAIATYVKSNEVQQKMNDIERMVTEYELACEYTKESYEAFQRKNQFISYVNEANKTVEEERERERAEANGEEYDAKYRGGKFSSIVHLRYTADDLNEELDRLRHGYWELILQTDDFRQHLTNDASVKLTRQIEAATDLEINLHNIRMLLTAIQVNHTDMLADSVVNMFDKVTRHHMNQYSSNIHYYNGWKTNDAYRINKKIVIPISHRFEPVWDFADNYVGIIRDVRNYIDDMVKAFQLIDPNVSSEFVTISKQEFENDLLRFRMFLNGNIHVWFKDEALLAKLNYFCGQHYAWIPGEEEQRGDVRAREWVAKEFGDMKGVTLLTN